MYLIEKVSEVKQVQLLVRAGKRDAFQGTVTQQGTLPHVFSYGKNRVMRPQCAHCGREVVIDFAFGGQILAGGDLSRQDFHEDRRLLDAVAALFGQYLHVKKAENGWAAICLSDTRNLLRSFSERLANPVLAVTAAETSFVMLSIQQYIDNHWADYQKFPAANLQNVRLS